MANVDQGFEDFRCELIAHLSARLGLAPHVVASHLKAWLVDRSSSDVDWGRGVLPVRAPRTRH
jgi:hypothetical protein